MRKLKEEISEKERWSIGETLIELSVQCSLGHENCFTAASSEGLRDAIYLRYFTSRRGGSKRV